MRKNETNAADPAPGPGPKPEALDDVTEWVADVIRDRIVRGVLHSRERLVERTLSAELSVSRTPVREALKLLRAEGLVEISPNRGAQVTAYSAGQALALFDVISVVESLAAEKFAERVDNEELDRLEILHGAMLGRFREGDIDAYFALNSSIHDTIIDGSGNPFIVNTHRRLFAQARRGRYMAIIEPERLRHAVEEHETLMEALRRRDPAAAAVCWRTHLIHTGQTLAAILRKMEAN